MVISNIRRNFAFYKILFFFLFSSEILFCHPLITPEEKEILKTLKYPGSQVSAKKDNITEFVCSRFAPSMVSDIEKIIENLKEGKDPAKIENSLIPVKYLERSPDPADDHTTCSGKALVLPKNTSGNLQNLNKLSAEIETSPNLCADKEGKVDFGKLKASCGGNELAKLDNRIASACETLMLPEEMNPDAGTQKALSTFKKLYPKYADRPDAADIAKTQFRKNHFDIDMYSGLNFSKAGFPEMMVTGALSVEAIRSGQCKTMVAACEVQCAKKDSQCKANPKDFSSIHVALDYFEKYLNVKSIYATDEIVESAIHYLDSIYKANPSQFEKAKKQETDVHNYKYLKFLKTLRLEFPELSMVRQTQNPIGNPYPLLEGMRPQNFSESQTLEIVNEMRRMRRMGEIPDSERLSFAKTEIAMIQDYTERIEMLGGKSSDTLLCNTGWFLTDSDTKPARVVRKGFCNKGPENILDEEYLKTIVQTFSIKDVETYLIEANQRPDGPKNLVLQKTLSQVFESKIRDYIASAGADPKKTKSLLYSLGAFQGDFSRPLSLLREPGAQILVNPMAVEFAEKPENIPIRESLEASQKDRLNNISVWQLKAEKQSAYQSQLNHRMAKEFTMTNLIANGMPDDVGAKAFMAVSTGHLAWLAGGCAVMSEIACGAVAVDVAGDMLIYGISKKLETSDIPKIKEIDAAYTARTGISQKPKASLSETEQYFLPGSQLLNGEQTTPFSDPDKMIARGGAFTVKQLDYKAKFGLVVAQKYSGMDIKRGGGIFYHVANETSQYEMLNKAKRAVGVRVLMLLKQL